MISIDKVNLIVRFIIWLCLTFKDWELQNSQIWLTEIDVEN